MLGLGKWFSLSSILVMLTTIITGICFGHCDKFNWGTSWPIDDQQVDLVERSNKKNISIRLERSLYNFRQQPQQFYANSLVSFNLVTETRQDICLYHCTCQRGRNSFVTVTCNFQENPKLSTIFDSRFQIPLDATVMNIKLGTSTQFRLSSGLFNNNTINSLTIIGNYKEGEQVEITSDALKENNGPYPDINIQNVFTVIVRTKAFSGNCKFTVRNSNDLILYTNAFENAKVNGLLVEIKDLRISEKAFNSAYAKLRIESSHIDNIYRFEASLREIRFVNCSIGTINAGAFDVIKINAIVFEGCRIDVIKARAVTEKLFSDHVSILDASIGFIESEAIYGSGITELILKNNKIDTIHENAIYVTSINITIANNNIKHLGNQWLRVNGWSNVIVEKNQFGVFGGILLDQVSTTKPIKCRFSSNSVTKPLPGSLNLTNPYCILREISVNTPCRCDLDWLHQLSARDLRSELYCTVDDKLSNCFNSSTFNTLKYMHEVCDEAKISLDCVSNKNLKKVDGFFFTPEELEHRNNLTSELIIIATGILLLALSILVGLVILIWKCRKQSLKNNNEDCSISNNRSSRQHLEHLHEFSNEERRVITQTLLLIQKRYPEIYSKINKKTQQLLAPNLNEEKCVKTISQIVYLLNRVQSDDRDFMAFNCILTEHLQSPAPTVPPLAQHINSSIYSEPSFITNGDADLYTTTSTFVYQENSENSHDLMSANVPNSEHIYAEPNCAQQPLLRNEYALPVDGQPPTIDVYTEPVHDRERKLVPAYAVANTNTKTNTQQHFNPKTAHDLHCFLTKPYQDQITSFKNSQILPLSIALTANKQNNREQHHSNFNTTLFPSIDKSRNTFVTSSTPAYSLPQIKSSKTNQWTDIVVDSFSDHLSADELDMRGAAALPPDKRSNHSGGSNETIKIDDVIEYADT